MKKILVVSLFALFVVICALVPFVLTRNPSSTVSNDSYICPHRLSVTQDPATNNSVAKLPFSLSTVGSAASIHLMTVKVHLKREGQITGQTLYRNGSISTATLTRSEDRIVIKNSTGDQVVEGTPNNYVLELTIDKPDFTCRDLDFYLLDDGACSPDNDFVWTKVESKRQTLTTSLIDNGLCTATAPNFVWSGVANTAGYFWNPDGSTEDFRPSNIQTLP